MAVQERNSEMVSLLSADFIQKTDTVYLAGIITGCILALPGLVAFWPMGISLSDSNDIYADYAYSPGRSGGQTLNGGTAAGDDLTLRSTSNATKGNIFFGNSTYDEVNNRLGIGIAAPSAIVDVADRSVFRTGGSGTAGIWFADASGNLRTFIGLFDDSSTPVVGFYNNGWALLADSTKVLFIADSTPPGSNPSGGGYLYVEGGSLKFRGSSGSITTIAPA